MQLIVDLHLHSHFSRATSKSLTLEGLYKWGKIKGVNVIGTGDFTHPSWFSELRDKLEPAEPGLFRLKPTIAADIDKSLSESIKKQEIRFILTSEISNIYSKLGKVRKLHNLVIAPSFEDVSKINSYLERIGNLSADGRPILGLDSKELLKICLKINENILFIPAHIWTPWFAMFGSKSGFDSIKEAFDELSGEIVAVETGLSSDPWMNWRIKELQNIAIISNSDAHSPQKIGREATIFDCPFDYFQIISAIKNNDERLLGTIEFFPEEGKYHFDGHRICNVKLSADETKKLDRICPVCHHQLTVGVNFRVSELASFPVGFKPENHKKVEYIIPLPEIIAELKGVSVSTKSVSDTFIKVYNTLGNEFAILRNIPTKLISEAGFPELSLAVDLVRRNKVEIEPGYDGVYGKIRLFKDERARKNFGGQMSLL